VVNLPDLTFVLGLSGWTEQNWTGAGSFDLLNNGGPVDENLIAKVHQQLATRFHASPAELAATLQEKSETVWRACGRLCRQGRAIFNVESRHFRHRELFEEPIDEAKLFPPDERVERAQALLSANAIPFARCEVQETRKTKKLKTPDGPITREIVYRDWRVSGNVGSDKSEIVVGDTGRIIFGTCTCAFFQQNLMGRGPCEHMIALFKVSADSRADLPTSTPAATDAAVSAPRTANSHDEAEDEESFDDETDNNKIEDS
jgi:hypothetical protein